MAEEKIDEWKSYEDKKSAFDPIFARMDVDEALYFLEPYVMKYPDDSVMEDVENVTFNDPATFGGRAISTLGGAIRSTEIKGRNISDKQCTTIENFIEDMFFVLDERLANRDILNLDAFLNEQICIRGHIAARCSFYEEDKVFIPDVVPIDTRFLRYHRTPKGLKWVAPNTTRSKESIKDEYGHPIEEDSAEVVDFWTPKSEIVYIEEKEIKRKKNPYLYPPFIIGASVAGSMLKSAGAAAHRGEGIFWQNRGLFPEMNRVASILQTLNIMSFAGAVQFESEAGLKAKKPKKPPYGIRTTLPVEKGMGYKPFPINDIRQAMRLFYAILYTRIQQGGLSAIDYGNLTFPLSAVAIARLTSSRDQIFLPRLQGKSIFYQQLAKMMISQYKALGKKRWLGAEGVMTEYDPKDLEGDYQILFRFKSESKEQQIANLTEANASERFLSRHTIIRNVLKVADPAAEDERFSAEQAEKADEALFLYNRCKLFIGQKNYVPAWIYYYRLRKVLRVRKMTEQMPPPEKAEGEKDLAGKKPPATSLMPLIGQGEGGKLESAEPGTETEELDRAERVEEATAEAGALAKQEEVK